MHACGVFEFLEGVARDAGLREDFEACAGIAVGPRRRFDVVFFDARFNRREIAELMAAKPVMAFRLNKQRFRQVTQEAFDEAFRNGGKYQAEAYASGEPQETMRRFFAERAARRKARGSA